MLGALGPASWKPTKGSGCDWGAGRQCGLIVRFLAVHPEAGAAVPGPRLAAPGNSFAETQLALTPLDPGQLRPPRQRLRNTRLALPDRPRALHHSGCHQALYA